MFHFVGSCERRVRLDYDVFGIAVGGERGAGVEGVHFDLVDGWEQAGIAGEELVDL